MAVMKTTEQVSLISIAMGLASLTSSVDALKDRIIEYRADTAAVRLEMAEKHKENVNSISELKNDVQEIKDEQGELRMKIKQILLYAAAGGVIAGFLGKLAGFALDYFKSLVH
jgi:ribosomal protein L29